MEIDYGIGKFNEFVNSLQYKYPEISYVANGFWIDFISENNKSLYQFHIHTSWRIILDDKIISSCCYDYPFDYLYDENQKEQKENDFKKWCDKTKFMQNEYIKKIIVLNNCDLIIEWENGAIFNSFIDCPEDSSYTFYDEINDKWYNFYYGKIIQDDFVSKRKQKTI